MSDTSLYQDYAKIAALNNGLDPSIFSWQIGQESSWNPLAQNGNAMGIAQFMPGTAQQYGVDPTNPFSSIDGAAAYMRDLLSKNGGDYTKALQSYGTLSGAPQSVWDTYNSIAGGGSVPTTGNGGNGGNGSAQDDCNYDMTSYQYWACRLAKAVVPGSVGGAVTGGDSTPSGDCTGVFPLGCYIKKYGLALLVIIIGLILLVGAFVVYKK